MEKHSKKGTEYRPRRGENLKDYDIDREDGEYSLQGDDGVYYYKIDYAAVRYDVYGNVPAGGTRDPGSSVISTDIPGENTRNSCIGAPDNDSFAEGTPDPDAGILNDDSLSGKTPASDGASDTDVLSDDVRISGVDVSKEDSCAESAPVPDSDILKEEGSAKKKKLSSRTSLIIIIAAAFVLAAFVIIFFPDDGDSKDPAGSGGAGAENAADSSGDQPGTEGDSESGKPVVSRALTDESTLENDVFSALTYTIEGVTYTKNVVEQTADEPQAKNEGTYVIRVNLAACVVTVYSAGADGTETPVRSFACSPARDSYATPEGEFITGDNAIWCLLEDDSMGQYALFITGDIEDGYLFHSVPYNTQEKNDLEWAEYNKLGSPASLGCIRVSAINARWLCENVSQGSKIVIYSDENDEGPFGLPAVYFIPETVTEARGWDPTDPDPENPWHTYDFTLDVDPDAASTGIELKAGDTFDIRDYVTATDTYGHDLTMYVTYVVNDLQYGFSYETCTLEELQAEGLEDFSQEDFISYDFTNITFDEEGTYELQLSLNSGPVTARTVICVTVK